MSTIYKAAGIILQNRQLLVVRQTGKDYFISPGGTLEPGETVVQALIRELKEELTIDVAEANIQLFDRYKAPAASNPDNTVELDAYLVNKWDGTLAPSSEIEELRWLTADSADETKLGSIFADYVIPELVERNLID